MRKRIGVVAFLVSSLLAVSRIAHAQCPVGASQTVAFFVNGIDTDQEEANKNKKSLVASVNSYLNLPEDSDCINSDLAYNTNELSWVDLLQGYVQAVSSDTSGFWRIMSRLQTMPTVLQNLFSDIAVTLDKISYISDSDLRIQVEQYRHEIQDNKKKVIIVSHSQGNFYANEAQAVLSSLLPISKQNFEIVSVANPDSFVGGDPNGVHTTLYGDVILIVPGRQDPNTDTAGTLCNNNGQLPGTDSFQCHGFANSYLVGTYSREKILGQIVNAIPTNTGPTTLTLISGNGPLGSRDVNTQFTLDNITWQDAYVVPNIPPGYAPYSIIPGTQFVNWDPDMTIGPFGSARRYRTVFNLLAGFSAPSLTVQVHADNVATVFLNGVQIGQQTFDEVAGNFSDPAEVFSTLDTSLFRDGVNTIEFEIYNFTGPTAFDYKATVEYSLP